MIKHPATYTNILISHFADILSNKSNVLDPFAGVGKLALIKNYGFEGKVICNEIEKEWAESSIYNVDTWYNSDAENMDFLDSCSIESICTSPTYGNRMADSHNAKDKSKRITYTHFLGKQLNPQNTGQMQWGEKYRQKHILIYKECIRVLKTKGLFVLNISDHIRKGQIIPVTEWHKELLISLNLEFIREIKVTTPRMGFGANNKLRVEYESILIFIK